MFSVEHNNVFYSINKKHCCVQLSTYIFYYCIPVKEISFSNLQLLVLQITDGPILYGIKPTVVQIPNYYLPCLNVPSKP